VTSVPTTSKNFALIVSSLDFGSLSRIMQVDLVGVFPNFDFVFEFESAFDEFFLLLAIFW